MNPYNKDGAMFLRPRKFVQSCKKNGLFLRRHTLGVIFFYMMFLSIQIFIKPKATFFFFFFSCYRWTSSIYSICHQIFKTCKKKYSDITIIRYLIVSLQKNSYPPSCSQKFQHLNCLLKHICTHFMQCVHAWLNYFETKSLRMQSLSLHFIECTNKSIPG